MSPDERVRGMTMANPPSLQSNSFARQGNLSLMSSSSRKKDKLQHSQAQFIILRCRSKINTLIETDPVDCRSMKASGESDSAPGDGAVPSASLPGSRAPTCTRCRNHGLAAPLKDHKHLCLFRACECQKCALLLERRRRRVRAAHLALQRLQESQGLPRDGGAHCEKGTPAGKEKGGPQPGGTLRGAPLTVLMSFETESAPRALLLSQPLDTTPLSWPPTPWLPPTLLVSPPLPSYLLCLEPGIAPHPLPGSFLHLTNHGALPSCPGQCQLLMIPVPGEPSGLSGLAEPPQGPPARPWNTSYSGKLLRPWWACGTPPSPLRAPHLLLVPPALPGHPCTPLAAPQARLPQGKARKLGRQGTLSGSARPPW
ncbi:doublesex- and mab-3-related transcription factor C2 isoform 5-T6 [Sarcophilus harrisii]